MRQHHLYDVPQSFAFVGRSGHHPFCYLRKQCRVAAMVEAGVDVCTCVQKKKGYIRCVSSHQSGKSIVAARIYVASILEQQA